MKEITFDRSNLNDYGVASQLEWIETNGLGGWASSTVSGAHRRRYHGLLISAAKPPTQRILILSRLDETIVIGNERYELGCTQYPGKVYPEGYRHLTRFSRGVFPVFEYRAGEVTLRKTVAAIRGENTVVVYYEVLEAPRECSMLLRPLIAGRDYHALGRANDQVHREYLFEQGLFSVTPYSNCPTLTISVPGSEFVTDPGWYHNVEYLSELERGFDFREDLYCYGYFRLPLSKKTRFGIIVSTEKNGKRDAARLLTKERKRRESLLQTGGSKDTITDQLTVAADQFIVERSDGATSIIAGYPWFTDWGRDTMIALPGLCLTTGRTEEAKEILTSYRGYLSRGMLPNRFPDSGTEAEYNTVDATLWFFIATYRYLETTQDESFIKSTLLDALLEIIEWHQRGTRFNIRVDVDGLLSAGDPHSQLTWMDAKIDNFVVTPRYGKPVEVNALWYNALMVASEFCSRFGRASKARQLRSDADNCRASFLKAYWFEEGGYLYDCVNGNDHEGYQKDSALRPNQIIALSLPFALVSQAAALRILTIVEEKLLTPVGLRTLSPQHSAYRGRYEGDAWSRDTAYHQGTVWPWLLGPYVTALLRYGGARGKHDAARIFESLEAHLSQAGVGSISEIFDGDAPHTPRGCPFQAWSVGEALRAYQEFKHGERVERSHSPQVEGSEVVVA